MRLLTLKRVAARLDVSEKTVRRWMVENGFPQPIFLPGRTPRWDQRAVENWVIRWQAIEESGGVVKENLLGQEGTGRDRKGHLKG